MQNTKIIGNIANIESIKNIENKKTIKIFSIFLLNVDQMLTGCCKYQAGVAPHACFQTCPRSRRMRCRSQAGDARTCGEGVYVNVFCMCELVHVHV